MFSVLNLFGIKTHHSDLDGINQRDSNCRDATKIVCRDEIKTTGEHLNLASVTEPVIAVNEQEDGFADVSIRPLTYAEVAGLGTKTTRSNSSNSARLTFPIDEYEDSDVVSGDNDSIYCSDISTEGCAVDEEDDGPTVSVDVIAHEQYGDRVEALKCLETRRNTPRKTTNKRRD